MAKYLTKEQVVSSFKVNYLPLIEESQRSATWDILLDSLLEDKKISEKQRNTWLYPKELLT